MEQTPIPPLVSDEKIKDIRSRHDHALSVKASAYEVSDIYESDRLKTREVVQRLVDALDEMKDAFELYASCQCDGTGCAVCRKLDKADNALFVAESMNIKPSRP